MRLRFKRYFSHNLATYMSISHMFKENKRTCTEAIEFEDLREKTFPNTTNYFN